MTINCKMCGDRQWMILEVDPLDRAQDLVAPCLGCSARKSLHQIQSERSIKLERGPAMQWQEVAVR